MIIEKNKFLIVAVMAIIFFVGLFFYKKSQEVVPTLGEPVAEKNDIQTPEYIHVLSGDEFDIKLRRNKRIHAKLKVASVPEAKEKVILLINSSIEPKIQLFGEVGGIWLIDIVLTHDSQQVLLSDWLAQNDLVWSNKDISITIGD